MNQGKIFMKQSEVLYRGQFLQLKRHEGWEWVERVNCTGVVMILAMTGDNKVVLVEQYRIPIGASVIEFPAGLVGDVAGAGEDLVEAAHRELLEETGYEAGALHYLAEGPPSAGLSPETISIFLAKDLKKRGPGGGDATENIIVHEVDWNEIDSWLKGKKDEGCQIDPKVYAGLYFLAKAGAKIAE